MKAFLLLFLSAVGGFDSLVASDYRDETMMFDAANGWRQTFTDRQCLVSHTNDGGKHWIDVSPPKLVEAMKQSEEGESQPVTSLCPLDARRTWVAIAMKSSIAIEFTADAGQHWRHTTAPIETEWARTSFTDELHGFLLASSLPVFGHQDNKVYGTKDGGKHWDLLNAPPARYTTGIVFRSRLEGWITGTYHGDDYAQLYRTRDGGKSWQIQSFEIPAHYRGGYANVYPPVFIGHGKKEGYLPVQLVRHEPKPGHEAWVNYETEDGGATWHLPASGVQSVPDQ